MGKSIRHSSGCINKSGKMTQKPRSFSLWPEILVGIFVVTVILGGGSWLGNRIDDRFDRLIAEVRSARP